MSEHRVGVNAEWKRVAAACASAIAALLCLWPMHSAEGLVPQPAVPATHGPYSTTFARGENPISEGGVWLNGQADGIDWANIRTTPRFAFGLEIGGRRKPPVMYDDATAILKGSWGPNQTAQATVRSVNQNQDGKVWEEVELRLRSTLTPHHCTGYEVMFRCTKIPKAYCNIARWEGPLGKFTYLKLMSGSQYGVRTGDVIKASMLGNVLTVYINGAQIGQVTDNKFKTGNPGMGFYLEGATGVNADYGFSNFMATDR